MQENTKKKILKRGRPKFDDPAKRNTISRTICLSPVCDKKLKKFAKDNHNTPPATMIRQIVEDRLNSIQE